MARQTRTNKATMSGTIYTVLLSLALFLQPAATQSNDYNTRADFCDTGGGENRAYASLAALQADIDEERERIDNNERDPPLSVYSFVLCADTEFVVEEDEALGPSLDNIQIQCGLPPLLSNNCTFSGNDFQVFVDDFAETENPVTEVFLTGITFSDFEEAALSGRASDITKVTFINTRFQNFDSESIVSQQVQTAASPFSVDVLSADIVDGNAVVAFLVEEASLVLEDIEVQNVNFTGSLVSAAGNTAFVTLDDSVVVESAITNILEIQSGADISVRVLNVENMIDIDRILLATGTGTTATIEELTAADNQNNPQTTSNRWEYIEASTNAEVTISESTFTGNGNVLHGFHANTGSQMTLEYILAENNEGALDGGTEFISAIAFAAGDGRITILDSVFADTGNITSALFSFEDSDIEAKRTCLSGLETQALLFSQFGSTMTIREDNGIEDSTSDDRVCPTEGLRLMVEETEASNCFVVPGDCAFVCENWGTFDDCARIPFRNQTDAPSVVPSLIPSSEPSLLPSDIPTEPSTSLPTIFVPTPPTPPPVTLAPDATASPNSSDQPSQVPTRSPSPTSSTAPSTSTRFPTTGPTLTTSLPTLTPSGTPSSLPTIADTSDPTLMPTTFTRSPTVSPTTATPTTSSPPSSSPTSNPTNHPTTSAAPSASIAPSNAPSVSNAPSQSPTSASPTTALPTVSPTTSSPSTSPTTAGPTTSLPTVTTLSPVSPSPTRCRIRPGKGKGISPGKGKGKGGGKGKGKGKGKGSVRKERVLGTDGYTYVYHYVYVDHPPGNDSEDDLPFCEETERPTPAPTPPPKKLHAPYYIKEKYSTETKSSKSKGKRRNLEADPSSAGSHQQPKAYMRKPSLFSSLQMWYRQ